MTEEAMIVHLPSNLCMDDLIELKYSSLTDSIHLVPLDNSFATLINTDTNEDTHIKGLEKTETILVNPEQATHKDLRKKLISSPLKASDGRYGCPYCTKTFSQKYIVPRHIKSMHENFYQKCHICNQFVKNVKQHLKFRHSEKQYVKCVVCDESYETKKLLREHLSNIHGNITLPTSFPTMKTCETCGIVLNSKKSLWLGHIYYQHMIPQRYFNCPLEDCPKTISKIEDDYNLKTHLLSYHDIRIERVYPCHLCPQKLLSPDDYAGHLEIDHEAATEVHCVVCKKSFKKYQLMALHLFRDHKSIFRGNFTPESSSVWKCAKFPIKSKRIPESKIPGGLFGLMGSETPQSTKYTFLKANNLDEFGFDTHEDNVIDRIGEVFQFDETSCDAETINNLGTEEFFLEIDQNIISKMLSINPDNAIDKSGSIKHKFQGLPKGTKILKATEDEVVIEVDDLTETETEPIKLDTEEASIEKISIIGNKDEDTKDLIQYLDNPIVDQKLTEHPEMEVFILHQNFENTIEVVARNDSEHQSSNDIKRRPKQPGKFPCPMKGCGKVFVAKHSVNMHVKNVHLAHSVNCEQCGKTYSNPDNLKVRDIPIQKEDPPDILAIPGGSL